jgi:hypothetical protein
LAINPGAAGNGSLDGHAHVSQFIPFADQGRVAVFFAKIEDLGGDDPGAARRRAAIPDEIAPANPGADDLIREFRAAVFQNAVGTVEGAFGIDITGGDKGVPVGRHAILVHRSLFKDKAGHIFGYIKLKDQFLIFSVGCLDAGKSVEAA